MLGFFGFRTSVVSSRFIIMRFSSSGADPAVQWCSARTSQPNSRLLQLERARVRASVSERACVLLSARVRARVTGVDELIQRLFLHVLHLLLHPGLHAQHSRSRDNNAAESHKQTHMRRLKGDKKPNKHTHKAASERAATAGDSDQCHCE